MPTPIDAIRPHPRNPRRIAQEALAKLCESIQRDPEFMRLRPIVVDAEGQILGGNQRWKACKALGFAELPDGWVVKADDLTDEQRRRFIFERSQKAGGKKACGLPTPLHLLSRPDRPRPPDRASFAV